MLFQRDSSPTALMTVCVENRPFKTAFLFSAHLCLTVFSVLKIVVEMVPVYRGVGMKLHEVNKALTLHLVICDSLSISRWLLWRGKTTAANCVAFAQGRRPNYTGYCLKFVQGILFMMWAHTLACLHLPPLHSRSLFSLCTDAWRGSKPSCFQLRSSTLRGLSNRPLKWLSGTFVRIFSNSVMTHIEYFLVQSGKL